jgi:peroxiredoxin
MINSSPLYKNINGKPQSYNIPEGNVILIGIPAAFSPTCTDKHLPEFAANIDKLTEHKVVFISVETPYTMAAWNEQYGHPDIDCVADPLGTFSETLSEISGTWEDVMGKTCKRFAYLIRDNQLVKKFNEPWFTDIYEDITNENN